MRQDFILSFVNIFGYFCTEAVFDSFTRLQYTAWKVSVFGVVLVHIFPHLSVLRSISPYSVQMRENTDLNNSEYGHFSRSDTQTNNLCLGFLLFEKLVGKFNRILLNVSISSPLESSENQTISGGFWKQNMGILAKNLKNFIKYFPVCFFRPGSCETPSCFKKSFSPE